MYSPLFPHQAAQLDSLLADTREVAGSALKAANAYLDIVQAIDEAYNASLSASMSAGQVQNVISSVYLPVCVYATVTAWNLNSVFFSSWQ